MSKRESSQIAADLETRFRTNHMFGDNNLDQWLVQKVSPRKGNRILDAGCGTGNHLIKLANSMGGENQCVGFDVSEQSILEARAKAAALGATITFVVASFRDLDSQLFPDASFDIVTSVYSIYYADDVKSALTALSRKLKATGRMAIMGPHGDNNKQWFEFLSQYMELPANIERISGRFMLEEVEPFARWRYRDVLVLEFVNNIRIPSYEDLRNYWVSNVYYRKELDDGFERFARQHFARFESFDFSKKGLLILMSGPRP
jgi:ubiquinone/menaquinone biosynthesis C-methylase UbiE